MTCLVFDLDGTLVDSAPDLHSCTNVLMDELGLPALDLPTVTGFIGHGVGPLVEASLAHNGKPQTGDELTKTIAWFSKIYAADPARYCKPYAGVMQTLKALKADGYKLAICTNKAFHLARLVVDAVGLDEYCPVLVGGDSLPQRKPDPAPLLECAKLLHMDDFIYVGDSETDAGAAQNADVPFMLHTKGYRKTTVNKLYHTVTFSKWDAFLPLLKTLNS